MTSTPPRGLNHCDVDFCHLHHGRERALGCGLVGIGDRFREGTGCDLPGEAPLVLAPAACALLTTVADDGIPEAVGFGLVLGRNLERKRLVVFELRSAVQAQAGYAFSNLIAKVVKNTLE